jgi:hypothetical protein
VLDFPCQLVQGIIIDVAIPKRNTMVTELADGCIERGIGGSVLVDDDPDKEKIDLIVFPQIQDLGVIVLQEDKVHHLTQILEVGIQLLAGNVLNQGFHPALQGECFDDVYLCLHTWWLDRYEDSVFL